MLSSCVPQVLSKDLDDPSGRWPYFTPLGFLSSLCPLALSGLTHPSGLNTIRTPVAPTHIP